MGEESGPRWEGKSKVPNPKKAGNKVEDKIKMLAHNLRSFSLGAGLKTMVGGTPRS